MKFVCDHMLGTLAKWLRLLGFDVVYPGSVPDSEIIKIASDEDRIILTRDKELVNSKKIRGLYVESDNLEEQLSFTISELHLKVTDPMSRCSICNSIVEKVEKSDVEGKVPNGVFERQEDFWFCPNCNKFYWKGSHWDKITSTIEGLIES